MSSNETDCRSLNEKGLISAATQSNDPDVDEGEQATILKAKSTRACDVCRKRKVRCDFMQLPSGKMEKCLNCFSRNAECTFNQPAEPRPKKAKRDASQLKSSEVEQSSDRARQLEDKIERSQRLLKILCPDNKLRSSLLDDELGEGLGTTASYDGDASNSLSGILSRVLGRDPIDLAVMGVRSSLSARSSIDDIDPQLDSRPPSTRVSYERQSPPSHTQYDEEDNIDPQGYFLGKSSNCDIVNQVFTMKEQSRPPSSHPSPYTQSLSGPSIPGGRMSTIPTNMPSRSDDASYPANDDPMPVDMSFLRRIQPKGASSFMGQRRREFWSAGPWEEKLFRLKKSQGICQTFVFPELALLHTLVDHYFKHMNLELPLLHRPTIERNIANGLHRSDPHFGVIVLVVCAIGARYSDDPRVKVSGAEVTEAYKQMGWAEESPSAEHRGSDPRLEHLVDRSKGWKYFEQAWIEAASSLFVAPPTVYDLQFYALVSEYLMGSSISQMSWMMVGVGIRLAQEVGAHMSRKKGHDSQDANTVREDELRKRAFWVLFSLDRTICSGTGRPAALQDEDFDVELPLECDDEYWDVQSPEKPFRQPEGQPSLVTAFSLSIRLNQILGMCLRTVYSTKKSQAIMGITQPQQWQPRIVRELDSALNSWLDSVPPHLRWDPNQPNEDFFNQSAFLYASFYNLQILVHRPFIPSPGRAPTLPFPSMEICTAAARSLIRICHKQFERTGENSCLTLIHLTTAGIVMLLKIWESERAGKLTEQARQVDMDDVNVCLAIIKAKENRWHMAGKLWDLLSSLASAKPGFRRNHGQRTFAYKGKSKAAEGDGGRPFVEPSLSSSSSFVTTPLLCTPLTKGTTPVRDDATSPSPFCTDTTTPGTVSVPSVPPATHSCLAPVQAVPMSGASVNGLRQGTQTQPLGANSSQSQGSVWSAFASGPSFQVPEQPGDAQATAGLYTNTYQQLQQHENPGRTEPDWYGNGGLDFDFGTLFFPGITDPGPSEALLYQEPVSSNWQDGPSESPSSSGQHALESGMNDLQQMQDDEDWAMYMPWIADITNQYDLDRTFSHS